jgi:AcrR family transcriptional regulator
MPYQIQTDPITQQILQAAVTLLAQVGDGFTMDQLAAQAQVPRATLYRRVGSKIALLQRLAQEQGISFTPQLDIRTRILQAARQLFGRTGLVNTTMEQVAETAAVGVATVYRHFGDKDHLVLAVVEELSPRAFVRDFAQPTADVTADLLTLTSTLLPLCYEYRDILRIILTGNAAERAYIEQMRIGSNRVLDQIAAYFATQIAAGRLQTTTQPNELALAYLGLLFAFTVIGPTHYGTTLEQPERISTIIVQLFLHGLLRREP